MTSKPLSYRQIMVGRFMTGLSGMDETFATLLDAGRDPKEDLGSELVRLMGESNYIPHSAQADYAAALLREYRQAWERRQSGAPPAPREMWRGIPREQVPWFPVLDEAKCDGCDKCLRFCGSGVFARRESGVVYVAEPFRCLVGCDACARLCRWRAITFPPKHVVTMLGK